MDPQGLQLFFLFLNLTAFSSNGANRVIDNIFIIRIQVLCFDGTLESTICSAQRVPEPDPLSGISFDTRPDMILFWKSLGSG